MKPFPIVLILLSLLSAGCSNPPATGQINWRGPDEKIREKPFYKSSYGAEWRALIWDHNLYFKTDLDGAQTIARLDLKADQGVYYEPFPSGLAPSKTIGFQPISDKGMLWVYQTESESTAGALFGPQGWVMVPREVHGVELQLPSLLGLTSKGDGFEMVLWPQSNNSQVKYDPLIITVPMEGNPKEAAVPWQALGKSDPENVTLLGAIPKENGWQYYTLTSQDEKTVLSRVRPGEEPEMVTDQLDEDVFYYPARAINRLSHGLFGFDPDFQDSPYVFAWDQDGSLVRQDLFAPDPPSPHPGFYQVKGDRLEWQEAFEFRGQIFQKFGDKYLSASTDTNKIVLYEHGKGPIAQRPLPSTDLLLDFLLVKTGGNLFFVDPSGLKVEINPDK